jgi:pilus assembly protein CpaF
MLGEKKLALGLVDELGTLHLFDVKVIPDRSDARLETLIQGDLYSWAKNYYERRHGSFETQLEMAMTFMNVPKAEDLKAAMRNGLVDEFEDTQGKPEVILERGSGAVARACCLRRQGACIVLRYRRVHGRKRRQEALVCRQSAVWLRHAHAGREGAERPGARGGRLEEGMRSGGGPAVTSDLDVILTHLAPLRAFIEDPTISEIEVNSGSSVYYERDGVKRRFAAELSQPQLTTGIKRIAKAVGEEVFDNGDWISPALNCRCLEGGWRLSVLFPPHSLHGITLCLRKFNISELPLSGLVERGMLDQGAADYLTRAVADRKNVLISGATGSGKTTLVNALLEAIPEHERVLTIENPAELRARRVDPKYANVVRWEARADFDQQRLLENALRFNFDRLLVGEFRGEEGLTLLLLLNTGHAGTLSTTHANGARDALGRFQLCVQMSPKAPPADTIRQMIGENIQVVAHLAKDSEGRRSVEEIIRVDGYDEGRYQTETVYQRVASTELLDPQQVDHDVASTGCHATR